MIDQTVSFEGPFRYMPGNDCVFDQVSAKSPGIYLWTIDQDGKYLVNYVGISTQSISKRLQDHLGHYYCGDYTIYEPEEFAEGSKNPIYIPTGSILDFGPRFMDLAPSIDSLVKMYSLFIAKVEGDKNWLERLESGVINQLRGSGEITANFLDNYRISIDHPYNDKQRIGLSSPVKFEGLGSEILA